MLIHFYGILGIYIPDYKWNENTTIKEIKDYYSNIYEKNISSINLYNRDNYHELGYPKDPDDLNWKILDMNIRDNYIGTPLIDDKKLCEMNINNNSKLLLIME